MTSESGETVPVSTAIKDSIFSCVLHVVLADQTEDIILGRDWFAEFRAFSSFGSPHNPSDVSGLNGFHGHVMR